MTKKIKLYNKDISTYVDNEKIFDFFIKKYKIYLLFYHKKRKEKTHFIFLYSTLKKLLQNKNIDCQKWYKTIKKWNVKDTMQKHSVVFFYIWVVFCPIWRVKQG